MRQYMLPHRYDLGGVKKRLLLPMLIFCAIVLCAGCNPNKNSGAADNILYKNNMLGFSLELPETWKNAYLTEESDRQVVFYCKKIHEKSGAGFLFTIERMTGKLITEEDMRQAPTGQKIILQGNGYTYFARMPSDVQYPPDDKTLSAHYQTMAAQINYILDSAALLGSEKPQPANEGYVVVGSSFFTVEIPENWELRAPDRATAQWPIYIDNKIAGGIELIPYPSEIVDNTGNDTIMRAYLLNDDNSRQVCITLNAEYAKQDTMEKIKKSFKFVNGPFNVVDLQTIAEKYLAGGGKKVFGQIADIEVDNGKPTSVQVKTMKFITDDSAQEYPNGFRIEDLQRIETYSLDFGVMMAPLVSPNHNAYGFYEIPTLDENYLKNNDYKNYYYDFILGPDGQLKIILGHYIP